MFKFVLLCVMVVGGLTWYLQASAPASAGGQVPGPGGAGLAMSSEAAASSAGPTAPEGAAPASAVSGTTSSPGAEALTGKRISELGLTRQLAGDHLLMMEGRQRRVIGSKEVVGVGGASETVLLLRDELSGQITYHRAGLQFTLKDGSDYEAYIREHPRMRRLFVNPLHAQVAVDAAEIAAEYSALAGDPRVVALRLLNREPVHVPK